MNLQSRLIAYLSELLPAAIITTGVLLLVRILLTGLMAAFVFTGGGSAWTVLKGLWEVFSLPMVLLRRKDVEVILTPTVFILEFIYAFLLSAAFLAIKSLGGKSRRS